MDSQITANTTTNDLSEQKPHLSSLMLEALTSLSSGKRLAEISKETGISTARISITAQALGVKRGVFEEVRDAVQLVQSGECTVSEASKKTGVSKYRIYYAIREQLGDETPRKLSKAVNKDRADVMSYRRDFGFTMKQIGEEFGLTRQRVHQILQKRELHVKTGAWNE